MIKKLIRWINDRRKDAKMHPNTGYSQVPDGRKDHEDHLIHIGRGHGR